MQQLIIRHLARAHRRPRARHALADPALGRSARLRPRGSANPRLAGGRAELSLLFLGASCVSLMAAVFGPIGLGATLMVIADLLGRSLFAPVEVPIGLLSDIKR
ncbi:hypothetical protein AJ87_19815 [Rhizobium yanglingense]|nr:hypothetical protein AJ87_19815 [Rhizobium yanglingense]